MTVSQRQRDLDKTRSGLERWLRRNRPQAANLTVAPLRPATAGFSSETLFVDVRYDEAGGERVEHLVARLPPAGGGIFPTYDLGRQARVQEALGATPIPVARPVGLELDDGWAGDPFFLMERIPGRTLPPAPPYVAEGDLHDAPVEVQERVQREFLQILADVHRLDWERLDLGFLTPPGERGLGHELGRVEDYLAWAADGDPPPVLSDGLEWCRGRIPDPEPPPSLMWGDPRIGNVVYDESFGAAALIDWEMASIGPAETDLAWFLAMHEASALEHGSDLPGFRDIAGAITLYAARLGREVRDYRWYEVFSLVRSEAIYLRIRLMLLAAGMDEPWLHGMTPGQLRIAALTARR